MHIVLALIFFILLILWVYSETFRREFKPILIFGGKVVFILLILATIGTVALFYYNDYQKEQRYYSR
jgi:glucan phosphoethanolaminetransferase (alkaline phosphatase superfamily)